MVQYFIAGYVGSDRSIEGFLGLLSQRGRNLSHLVVSVQAAEQSRNAKGAEKKRWTVRPSNLL